MNKSLQSSYPDQTRNLNPTPIARVAMIIYGKEYSEQRGGSMEFWDSLSPLQHKRCRLVIQLYYDMAMEVVGDKEGIAPYTKRAESDEQVRKKIIRNELKSAQTKRLKQQTGL